MAGLKRNLEGEELQLALQEDAKVSSEQKQGLSSLNSKPHDEVLHAAFMQQGDAPPPQGQQTVDADALAYSAMKSALRQKQVLLAQQLASSLTGLSQQLSSLVQSKVQAHGGSYSAESDAKILEILAYAMGAAVQANRFFESMLEFDVRAESEAAKVASLVKPAN